MTRATRAPGLLGIAWDGADDHSAELPFGTYTIETHGFAACFAERHLGTVYLASCFESWRGAKFDWSSGGVSGIAGGVRFYPPHP